ncbi:50S ribosomal protein L15 [Patescibacteria group bacterium]|nr:50S ribosomal protein L15 [Patescibacteria group bacterium]
MTLSLSNLKAPKVRKKKRVGRGDGSGRGTYSGRGLKGQRSRSGGKRNLKRRGLKQSLQQIPKSRGFKSFRPVYNTVNIVQLSDVFEAGSVVSPARMLAAGLVKSKNRIKVLGHGVLKNKMTIQAHRFSKSAERAIKKAGGNIQVIIIKINAPKSKELRNKLRNKQTHARET